MKKLITLPESKEDQINWLTNFSNKFPDLSGEFGITTAETASLLALINDVRKDLEKNSSSDIGLEDYRQSKKQAMIGFLSMIIVKMKLSPNYKENYIQMLGLDQL